MSATTDGKYRKSQTMQNATVRSMNTKIRRDDRDRRGQGRADPTGRAWRGELHANWLHSHHSGQQFIDVGTLTGLPENFYDLFPDRVALVQQAPLAYLRHITGIAPLTGTTPERSSRTTRWGTSKPSDPANRSSRSSLRPADARDTSAHPSPPSSSSSGAFTQRGRSAPAVGGQ